MSLLEIFMYFAIPLAFAVLIYCILRLVDELRADNINTKYFRDKLKKFVFNKISDKQLIICSITFILSGIVSLLFRNSFAAIPVYLVCFVLWGLSIVSFAVLLKKRKFVLSLLNEAEKYTELSNKSKTIAVFIQCYEKLLQILQELMLYEKQVSLTNLPTDVYNRLLREKQKHLQDALRRELHYKLENKENTETNYKNFCKEIEFYKNKFDAQSLTVAEECKNKLISETIARETVNPLDTFKHTLTFEQIVNSEMTNIDLMYRDGWEFEQYSAKLLHLGVNGNK